MIVGSTGTNGNGGHECHRLVFIGKGAVLQFVKDCSLVDKLVCLTTMVPPGPCPVTSSNHLWFGPYFVVEAGMVVST